MGRASKQKGSSYERRIASLFSEIFKPLVFKRVPLSGGWDKTLVTGDLIPWLEDVITYFAFSIECKNHKTLSLKAWIRQAEEDIIGKIQQAIVIFHVNRRKGLPKGEDFVAIEVDTLHYYLKSSVRKAKPAKIEYADFRNKSRWSLEEWIQEVFGYQSDNKIRAIFLDYDGRDFAILRLNQFLGIVNRRRAIKKLWGIIHNQKRKQRLG